MNNYVLSYASPSNYNADNAIVSVTISKPGVYLIIAYNHNQNNFSVWLNGETDQNSNGYVILDSNACLAKICYVDIQTTFSLINLSGQTMYVNGSTYIGAIRLCDS